MHGPFVRVVPYPLAHAHAELRFVWLAHDQPIFGASARVSYSPYLEEEEEARFCVLPVVCGKEHSCAVKETPQIRLNKVY